MKKDQSPVCYKCGHDMADSTYPGEPSGEPACFLCTRNPNQARDLARLELNPGAGPLPPVIDRYVSADMMGEFPKMRYPHNPPRIVAAAIKHREILAIGTRHSEIIHSLAEAGVPTPVNGEQGFLDSYGRFLDRQAAGRIAINAGQIAAMKWPGMGLDSSEVFPREAEKEQVHG